MGGNSLDVKRSHEYDQVHNRKVHEAGKYCDF